MVEATASDRVLGRRMVNDRTRDGDRGQRGTAGYEAVSSWMSEDSTGCARRNLQPAEWLS